MMKRGKVTKAGYAASRANFSSSKTKSSSRKKVTMRQLPASVRPEVKRYINDDWKAETLDDYKAISNNFNINQLAAGTSYSNRIGDKVFSKSFYFKGHIEGSAGASYNNYRIDVIEDREPAAGNPSWTDIYNDNSGASATSTLQTVLNPVNRNRFRIRKTVKGTLNNYLMSTTGPTISPGVRDFKFLIKTNKSMRFNTDSAANPYSGIRYYVIGWSDVSANTPKVWMTTEHRFTDA